MKQSSGSVAAACIALTAIAVVVGSASARADSADVLASGKDGGAIQSMGFGAKDGGAASSEGRGAKDGGFTVALGAKDGGFAPK